jgi:hypothetical protein
VFQAVEHGVIPSVTEFIKSLKTLLAAHCD